MSLVKLKLKSTTKGFSVWGVKYASEENCLYLPFTSAAGGAFAEAPERQRAGRYLRPGSVWTPYEAGASGRWTYRCSGWRCCGEGSLSTARRPCAAGWGWKRLLVAEAEGSLRSTVSGTGLLLSEADWTSWPERRKVGLRIPASPRTGSIEKYREMREMYLTHFLSWQSTIWSKRSS